MDSSGAGGRRAGFGGGGCAGGWGSTSTGVPSAWLTKHGLQPQMRRVGYGLDALSGTRGRW